jgi:hypothetical protein
MRRAAEQATIMIMVVFLERECLVVFWSFAAVLPVIVAVLELEFGSGEVVTGGSSMTSVVARARRWRRWWIVGAIVGGSVEGGASRECCFAYWRRIEYQAIVKGSIGSYKVGRDIKNEDITPEYYKILAIIPALNASDDRFTHSHVGSNKTKPEDHNPAEFSRSISKKEQQPLTNINQDPSVPPKESGAKNRSKQALCSS